MSQAEKIRELVLEWLRYEGMTNTLLDLNFKEINVNNKVVKAMKYKDIKEVLLEMDEFNFTEGAVTGALRTLPDRLDFIFKTKNKDGVFYYFSDEETSREKEDKIFITESDEYENLILRTNELHADIGKLLRDASNGMYFTKKDTDVKYLRKLLEVSSDLKGALENYRLEKAFEKIENTDPFDDLPF